MGKYKYLFWDLDGTLVNSFAGCSSCFAKVFDYFELDIPISEHNQFIGPPLRTSFMRILGDDTAKADIAYNIYCDAYRQRDENIDKLFDGIVHTLTAIKAKGYKMYVATSKGQVSARELLARLGVSELFESIYGADYSQGRIEKEQVLAEAITQSGADKSKSLMIGDSVYDVRGANYVGIDCIACTYGFGSIEEMRAEGIVAECESVEKLIDLF